MNRKTWVIDFKKDNKKNIKMKNLYNILLIFLIVSLFGACQKDVFTEVPGTIIPIDPGPITIVQTNLTGVVLDAEKEPIIDAEILVAGQVAVTDSNGVFRFINIDLSSNGSLIKILKDGYFEGFQFVSGLPGENSYQESILVKKESQNFDSATGGLLEINGGSSIQFQPNTIMDNNGTSYQGEVIVNAHWYDPSTKEIINTMPGDLRGMDSNEQAVQLLSYGMMAVELSSPGGAELQLGAGNTATLKFPIPNGSNAADFNTIPTWHLDENTGVWIEEGEALVGANFLTAEVAHFSFWNCDAPFPVVNVKGRLINEDGSPVPYQQVVIKDEHNNISQSGFTNESGVFCGMLPAGVDLTISILYCDQEFFVTEISALSVDQDLGDIDILGVPTITILASLEDCASLPVINGYVTLETAVGSQIISPDANGNINHILIDCLESEGILTAYDLTASKASEPINFNIDQPVINLETISICDEITGEFINVFIEGTIPNEPSDDIEVIIADNQILYILAKGPQSTEGNLMIKYDLSQDRAEYIAFGINSSWVSGSDLEMEVSAFGNEGDFITLSFDNGEIRGDMQVMIDDLVTSAVIRGKVWLDANENGIREAGELPLAGKNIRMEGLMLFSSTYYPTSGVFEAVTDADGNFILNGVIVGQQHSLIYFLENGEQVSPANIENDDTIDSDYVPSTGGSVTTGFFLVEEGGEYIDFGLGIIQ